MPARGLTPYGPQFPARSIAHARCLRKPWRRRRAFRAIMIRTTVPDNHVVPAGSLLLELGPMTDPAEDDAPVFALVDDHIHSARLFARTLRSTGRFRAREVDGQCRARPALARAAAVRPGHRHAGHDHRGPRPVPRPTRISWRGSRRRPAAGIPVAVLATGLITTSASACCPPAQPPLSTATPNTAPTGVRSNGFPVTGCGNRHPPIERSHRVPGYASIGRNEQPGTSPQWSFGVHSSVLIWPFGADPPLAAYSS